MTRQWPFMIMLHPAGLEKAAHFSSPTLCFTSRHMFTPTPVAACWKRRNITPPFHMDKAADCSLYLAANVPPFLSKRGCCWPSRSFQVKNRSNIFWASCTIQALAAHLQCSEAHRASSMAATGCIMPPDSPLCFPSFYLFFLSISVLSLLLLSLPLL